MTSEKNLTLDELETQYAHEWVLVQETEWDAQGNPTRALMVAHDVERANLVQAARSLHKKSKKIKTFTFYAGPKLPEGLVVVL